VNADRARIQRAILAELPTVDYAEKIKRRAQSLAVATLPPAAKGLWNDSATRGLISVRTCYFPYSGRRNYAAASVSLPGFESHHDTIKKDPEIVAFVAAYEAQRDTYDKLKLELVNNLASVSTHEAFAERWPELARFLPDGSEAKCANLPATTALIDGLRAAGLRLDKVPEPA
jgi:hypothetical protein